MYDGTLPSDQVKRFQRVDASAAITIRKKDGAMRPDRLYQSGAGKIRLPKSYAKNRADVTLINTAGGLTGGDVFAVSAGVEEGAAASITTQACEKIYRSLDGSAATVTNSLTVGEGARLAWVPQETIFFDRASLKRDLTADLAEGGSLIALEPILFGRTAMGEVVHQGAFRDAWTIRRDGKVIFADRTDLSGDIADILNRPGIAQGAMAYAAGIYIGPDAEAVRDAVRAVPEGEGVTAGASVVAGPSSINKGEAVVSFRCLAKDGLSLRRWIGAAYRAAWGEELPRVWGC